MAQFKHALQKMIAHEGGSINDSNDAGGRHLADACLPFLSAMKKRDYFFNK